MNTKQLGKELAIALEKDRIYKVTDEMKKKAITKVSNYDEFKNYVACADLIPMSTKEIQELHVSNKSMLRSRYKKDLASQRFNKEFEKKIPESKPKNAKEFVLNYNRHCTSIQDKYDYLQLTTVLLFKRFFKNQLDTEILESVFNVLVDCPNFDEKFATHLLLTLPKTGRFALNISFIDAELIHNAGRRFGYRLQDDCTWAEICTP